MSRSKATVKKGEVDVERMAEEQKIPVAKIKAYLGLTPATAEEARERYEAMASQSPNKQEALETWLSLCKTPEDFYQLYRNPSSKVWENIRGKGEAPWIKVCGESIESATDFSQAYTIFRLVPSGGSQTVSEDWKQVKSDAAKKMLSLVKTASEALQMYSGAYEHIQDRTDFLVLWYGLCVSNDDICQAFDRCHDTFALKRIDICSDVRELKKVYRKVDQRKHEGAFILKMAEFYRK